MFSGVPTAVFQTASRETDAPPLAFAGFKKNAAAKSAQRTEREDKKRKAMTNPAAGDEDEGDGEERGARHRCGA